MKNLKSKKTHNGKIPRPTENFRKRALVIAIIMAISGLLFLGIVFYYTGFLEIF